MSVLEGLNSPTVPAVVVLVELSLFVRTFVALDILNWHCHCFLIPLWYFGDSLSYFNGYYRHYGGNAEVVIASEVGSYEKTYDWRCF